MIGVGVESRISRAGRRRRAADAAHRKGGVDRPGRVRMRFGRVLRHSPIIRGRYSPVNFPELVHWAG